jgi:hypothetical protein
MINFAKKLAKRIHFYDRLTKRSATNPFAKEIKETVVWVEDRK